MDRFFVGFDVLGCFMLQNGKAKVLKEKMQTCSVERSSVSSHVQPPLLVDVSCDAKPKASCIGDCLNPLGAVAAIARSLLKNL